MKNIFPVTSAYAVVETRRNLLFADPEICVLPSGINLAEKDRPILAAAIHAGVDFLVTGDKRHFGHLYQKNVAGVRIISPADFLNSNDYRLPT